MNGVSQLHMGNVLSSPSVKWTSMRVTTAALITLRCAMATGTNHISLVRETASATFCYVENLLLQKLIAKSLYLQDDSVAVITSLTQ